MKIMAGKQHGFSFSGFLMVVVLIVFGAIGVMKLIPAYLQDAKIKSIFNTIVHDPDMQNASVKAIRDSFGKRASVDAVTAINETDIEISKDQGGISLSASYLVRIPLAGNASLILEFNPSSTK